MVYQDHHDLPMDMKSLVLKLYNHKYIFSYKMEYGLQTFQNSFGLLFVFKIIFTALCFLLFFMGEEIHLS